MAQDKQILKRYNLDNSALFYPIMSSKKAQKSIFRLEMDLIDCIDKVLLEQAVNDVLNRFPTFKVRLKKGYSWHYFEENNAKAKIFDIDNTILRPINTDETNGFLFRVACFGNKIVLEIFHGLCDGTGALLFLRAIVQRYRQLQNVYIADNNLIIDLDAEATDDEIEDAFKRYYKPIKFGGIDIKGLTGSAPHLLKGTIDKNGFSAISKECEYSAISKLAKTNDATFTAYVAGLLAYSIEKAEKGKLPIVMMVPVNLRSVFPSQNMRNFVTFVRLVFNPATHKNIDEYVLEAKKQLTQKATKEKLSEIISTTVRAEKSLLLRISPLCIKMAIARFFRLFLKSRQTIIFSNLGRTDMPDEYGIVRVVFDVNVSKNAKVNLGVTSTNGRTLFSFTKSIEDNNLSDTFFDELEKLGVNCQSI